MRIKFQISAESVLHHHNQHPNAISSFHPLLDHVGSKGGQVVKQMAVLSKDGPENVWHGKHDARILEYREAQPTAPVATKAWRDTRNSGKLSICRYVGLVSPRLRRRRLPRPTREFGNRAFLRSSRGRRGGSRIDPTDLV